MQILEKCEDVNTKNQYEKTPLHLAAEEGHIETVKSLLANGADPSIQDKNKKTPLQKKKDLQVAIHHKHTII